MLYASDPRTVRTSDDSGINETFFTHTTTTIVAYIRRLWDGTYYAERGHLDTEGNFVTDDLTLGIAETQSEFERVTRTIAGLAPNTDYLVRSVVATGDDIPYLGTGGA